MRTNRLRIGADEFGVGAGDVAPFAGIVCGGLSTTPTLSTPVLCARDNAEPASEQAAMSSSGMIRSARRRRVGPIITQRTCADLDESRKIDVGMTVFVLTRNAR